MKTAEARAEQTSALMTWAEICSAYPNEWVCLVEIQLAPSGAISAGHLVAHNPSMKATLDQLRTPSRDHVVAHTSGRSLRPPRMELTDEVRDLVRARR
jgi:hypothetical protein